MQRNKAFRACAVLAATAMMAGNFQMPVSAQETSNIIAQQQNQEEYEYVYAGISWAQYWESEGIYLSGTNMVASSSAVDTRGESDKGAFDAVSRATTNHGIHRGSFQCNTTIYGEDGKTFDVSTWKSASELVLTDGSTVGFNKDTITYTENGQEKTTTMKNYNVTGIKYVPVAVKKSDYEAFAAQYPVVSNAGILVGGYSEINLASYQKTAAVTANTNGLKVAEKQADGTFKFGKRATGTDSGIADQAQKEVSKDIVVKVQEANGSYGEFLRVDLVNPESGTNAYGELGANMQAVRWDYYGTKDAEKDQPIVSFGTKFAADNWMHKSNGIQLGLTNSLRCQLPEGTDGTGIWKITVYALGFKDFTTTINVTDANIVKDSNEEISTTALSEAIAKAKTLVEKEYTAASWSNLQTELAEAEDEIKAPHTQATVDEATSHLNEAINNLVKATVEEKTIVAFAKDKATVYVKGTTNVKATVKNAVGKTTYKSSNTKVAKVSSTGKVTALKKGTAKITVTNNGVSKVFTVTVKNPSLNSTKVQLAKNKTFTLKVIGAVGTVKYTSSNKKVATVNAKGKITAKKAGKTVVTVKSNGMTLKCNVTVK